MLTALYLDVGIVILCRLNPVYISLTCTAATRRTSVSNPACTSLHCAPAPALLPRDTESQESWHRREPNSSPCIALSTSAIGDQEICFSFSSSDSLHNIFLHRNTYFSLCVGVCSFHGDVLLNGTKMHVSCVRFVVIRI